MHSWQVLRYLLTVFLFCLCSTGSVYAGVSTVQALDFGEFLVFDNDSQYDITVDTDGSYSYDSSGYVLIAAPREGIYDLDGMTPNQAITSVTVTQDSALSSGVWIFQMVNFQETHDSSTDASGVARVTIGATARSSGSGALYPDRTYSGVVNILISF